MAFKTKVKNRCPVNIRLTLDAHHDQKIKLFEKRKNNLPKKKNLMINLILRVVSQFL